MGTHEHISQVPQEEEAPVRKKKHHKKKRKKRALKVLLTVLITLVVVLLLAVVAYFAWEKAPDVVSSSATAAPTAAPSDTAAVETDTKEETAEATPEPTEMIENGIAPDTDRQDGVYTILFVGNDDGTGNTDTMMVVKFDTVNHEINVCSLPRDSLINVDWDVRKLNSVYWASESWQEGEGIVALENHVRRFTGFDVDCYAVVDLDVFVDVVDALGGVWFDVPCEIEPEDWMGYMWDYWDTLEPGYQLLNGYQCMAVVRHRSSYIRGDLQRIEVQHDFIKAAASQFITLGNIPNASKVLKILSDRVNTNLSSANIAYFIRQSLMCDADDIHFYTMPTEPVTLQGYSYAVLNDLYGWLDIINTSLNPYSTPVTEGNLNVIYIDSNGDYHGTAGMDGDWYYEKDDAATAGTSTDSGTDGMNTDPGYIPDINSDTGSDTGSGDWSDTPVSDEVPTDMNTDTSMEAAA